MWDDELHVPAARDQTLTELLQTSNGQYSRPVVLLSYAAQARIGADSAAALHAANVLMHAVNAGLLALLALRVGVAPAAAAAAAILFAAHPLSSAAVAYVSGRTDLLAALFTIAAAHVALSATRIGAAAAAGAAGLLVVLASLSKETGVMAGAIVALLWWHRPAEYGGVRRPVPAAVMIAASLAAVVALMAVAPPALGEKVGAWLRLRGAGTALATFASLLAWPRDLHLDRLTATGGDWAAFLGLAFLAAALAILVSFLRYRTATWLAATAAIALYLPAAGVAPVYPKIAERLVFTGEQFLYLPLAPLAVLFAAAAAEAARRVRAAATGVATLSVSVLLAALWTPSVLARQHQLGDAERVYTATLASSPSPRACFNLGNLYLARREPARAAATYEQCAAMAPNDAETFGQLAIAYQSMRRHDDARRAYERALELDADNALLWSNLATLDANQQRYEEARRKWQRALELDPDFAPARQALERIGTVIAPRDRPGP
ncbi:MAG TPA: tetratricopeptide repeat protein [Candidatus Binatia bacterium]|nr:tetratricopeptide repeat protein [Candidatus Binatia bacterium]